MKSIDQSELSLVCTHTLLCSYGRHVSKWKRIPHPQSGQVYMASARIFMYWSEWAVDYLEEECNIQFNVPPIIVLIKMSLLEFRRCSLLRMAFWAKTCPYDTDICCTGCLCRITKNKGCWHLNLVDKNIDQCRSLHIQQTRKPIKLDGTSTARSRKWCLRRRAILQTKTEAIFQIQVRL